MIGRHTKFASAALCIAMAAGSAAHAVTRPGNLGLKQSAVQCSAGETGRFDYVATWTDVGGSGVYAFKVDNQCILNKQPCGTKASEQACTQQCAPNGQCKAAFKSCLATRSVHSVTVVSTNRTWLQELKYPVPDCRPKK